MTELLTAAQMRALEEAAIDSGKVTGLELMERAGAGVVAGIRKEWPALEKGTRRAVVLCGPGNNGGDGFVVARLLKARGWAVEVFLYADAAKLPPDAAGNYRRWSGMGEVSAFNKCRTIAWKARALVIDAVFGTGLGRAVPAEIRDALIAARATKRVAIDFPSFVDSDSGKLWADWQSENAAADLTVTFHRAKTGHFLADGPRVCGKIVVADIGLDFIVPKILLPEAATLATLFTCQGECASRLAKSATTHKYNHGHGLVVAGASGHGGAARLAARGALRIGAGLVTLACPPESLPENAAQVTAIMVRPFAGADGVSKILSDGRFSSICLGPGLGVTQATREMVEAVLRSQKKCVLDADGLSVFQNNPAELLALLHAGVVLTPHAGEFARLFPDIAQKLAAAAAKGAVCSKVDAARQAAARAGCVVLLKGPDTVIADQTGHCAINAAVYERAAPWLATAGSGDVLAGFIAGLLARGFAPLLAAKTAAWLHVECARSFGPGLIAEDLPEELPKVFRALAVG